MAKLVSYANLSFEIIRRKDSTQRDRKTRKEDERKEAKDHGKVQSIQINYRQAVMHRWVD